MGQDLAKVLTMNKWLKRFLIVAAIVVVIVVLKVTVLREKPIPIQVVTVERGTVEETVTNSRAGTVRARRRAKLSPEFGGQVIEIPYREGEQVRQGAVMLRMEDSLQRARLVLAEREVEASRAERERVCLQAERAGRELERTQRLADEEIISEDLLDRIESVKLEAEAACSAATANVARAQASVALAQTELEKTIVRAPFDGIVAEVATEVGEWTTPSPPALPVPPVLDLLDPTSVYISAPMDEVDSARMRQNQPTRVTVDSHRDETFPGHVSRVAPYVLDLEAQNRTVEIEVELEDHQELFLPGTSADVEVILDTREQVLRLPTAAIIEGDKVLVFEDGMLTERRFEPGLRNWDFTEVAAGLDEKDQIVISLDRAEVKAGAQAEIAAAEEE